MVIDRGWLCCLNEIVINLELLYSSATDRDVVYREDIRRITITMSDIESRSEIVQVTINEH